MWNRMPVAVLLLVALGLLVVGQRMPAYRDFAAWKAESSRLENEFLNAPDATAEVRVEREYARAWEQHVTWRYRLLDLSWISLLAAAIVFGFQRYRRQLLTVPKSRRVIALVGLIAVFLTNWAFHFGIQQGYNRDLEPYWIAEKYDGWALGAAFFVPVLLVWWGGHLTLVARRFTPGLSVRSAFRLRTNYWLVAWGALSLFISATSAVFPGSTEFTLPALLWAWFYLMLAAARGSQTETDVGLQPAA